MNKIIPLTIMLLLCPFCVFAEYDKEDKAKLARLEKHWVDFVEVIKTRSCPRIKPLLMEKVNCYLCLENTQQEYEELNRFRDSGPNWYDELYNNKIFIPRDVFCRDDVPILFNAGMLEVLQKNRTSFHISESKGKEMFEVLVTTTLPGEVGLGHEGGQHDFTFSEGAKGFKLYGVSTIP